MRVASLPERGPMHAEVGRELGVEGGDGDAGLAREDGVVERREDLDVGAEMDDAAPHQRENDDLLTPSRFALHRWKRRGSAAEAVSRAALFPLQCWARTHED